MTAILVIGGYGVFGGRAVERLVRSPNLRVVVAGRNVEAAAAFARTVGPGTADIASAKLDATSITPGDIRRLGASVVLHAAGPYQASDYRVARAAIEAGAHYIDLADARAFVTGITALNEPARAAGVLVTSGASSVPALAAAVIDHALPSFYHLAAITYGISPGDSFSPGEATVASIIDGAGRPFETLDDGRKTVVHGWQPLYRHRFSDPGIGTRWFGHCNVPDLDLFPERYPSLRTQRFIAGIELKPYHFGLWLLSWLVRAGLIRHPERMAPKLLRIKKFLPLRGSDRGAMFVMLEGTGRDGNPLTLAWELIADRGHGPYIPVTPAVIIAKRLVAGELLTRGALPCVGLITLEQFDREVADLAIHHVRL